MSQFSTKVCVAALLLAGAAQVEASQAKNVILMVSDGIGFNGWEAARYYQGDLPYDDGSFNFYGCTTFMNNVYDNDEGRILLSNGEANGTDAANKNWTAVPQGYDQDKMWSDFNYHRGSSSGDYNYFTDSAAAATALYTGTKTYNSAVSYSVEGEELKTFYEYAAEAGKATGSVSSVQFNHATPAAVDAHSFYRYNKDDIAFDMVNSDLDVIMGGDAYVDAYQRGDGSWSIDYKDHGNGIGTPGFKADAVDRGYTVVDTDAAWAALEAGTLVADKVAGIFTGDTLNGRDVPTLEQMTKGALNVLEQDEDGFAMMVEGGAIDWQNHANNVELMMREQVDFDNAVQAVMDWVEANSSWDETLLIVTSDHECGGIWGPNTVIDDKDTGNHLDDEVNAEWQNVVDNGVGVMPGVQYVSGGHTNALVPLWAKGAGADLFDGMIDGNDPTADAFWTEGQGWDWNGDYVDNTDVFSVMMQSSGVPEPASLSLLGLASLAVLRRRSA
ncbi:alkaline phosphatase [Mucisphaera calidilacus]|uniref:Alkaline phosphatase 3 n=1 Tax=Mucisphaera calidilacus TaxID=2527982 RepID=A0A518BZZ7_9BACT|nr:alkaline phosphatase [Mucisphaera calidilacus]QDU72543.1 Alkaline phosphatase 3 precursor [Mucisphaera calidilacus]